MWDGPGAPSSTGRLHPGRDGRTDGHRQSGEGSLPFWALRGRAARVLVNHRPERREPWPEAEGVPPSPGHGGCGGPTWHKQMWICYMRAFVSRFAFPHTCL